MLKPARVAITRVGLVRLKDVEIDSGQEPPCRMFCNASLMDIRKLLILLACKLLIVTASGCATTVNNATPVDTGAIQQNSTDISGSYNLIAVNGAAIPATVTHGNAQIKVHSGSFTIRADGSCTSKSVPPLRTHTPFSSLDNADTASWTA